MAEVGVRKMLEKGVDLTRVHDDGKVEKGKPFKIDFATNIVHFGTRDKVALDMVDEIRTGLGTAAFTKVGDGKLQADRCFSLVHGFSSADTMDVVCDSPIQAEKIVGFLTDYLYSMDSGREAIAKKYWLHSKPTDTELKGKMSKSEVLELLKRVNASPSKSHLSKQWKVVDANDDGSLQFNELSRLLDLLLERDYLHKLFKKYAGDSNMSPAELKAFLAKEQMEPNVTLDECTALVRKYGRGNALTYPHFEEFMCSPDNSAFSPAARAQTDDMTQPLSHYFIDSSHNTYLVGDQLKGESSIEAYVHALKLGCRCVEMDCWDGDDGEPIIYHGHTLTSRITVRDTVKAIKEFAFWHTPYPLILSLEMHCGVAQQDTIADIMTETLGDLLQGPSPDGKLGSPEQLKGRIIIKGKRWKPDAKKPVSKKLSDITYLASTAFKTFEASAAASACNISSFDEGKGEGIIKDNPAGWIAHNLHQTSRIYPAGTRVGSSNYDPHPFWTVGCQVVALNYQKSSASMWALQGMFERNGHTGYVLKPAILRDLSLGWVPNKPSPNSRVRKLTVKVLDARMLPKVTVDHKGKNKGEVVDPYVRISVNGVPADVKSVKTKTIDDNGFNPEWHQAFDFTLTTSELATLTFSVEDSDLVGSDNIAHWSAPVEALRPGLRCLNLVDERFRSLKLANVMVELAMA